jgi:hypothetical protein
MNSQPSKTNKIVTVILTLLLFGGVVGTVVSNYAEEYAVDNSKLPDKVERSKEFQKWINNHKKRFTLEADSFRFKEKNEFFNSAFITIKSSDDEIALKEHQEKLARFATYPSVRFSPNEFEFLDYRHEKREGDKYAANDVYYHGLREDKIIDTKILSCKIELNCYFDRGFFIDNNGFVISEISRNVDKKDIPIMKPCAFNDICTYTIKLHVYDFINSSRYVYESMPIDINLAEISQYF